MQNFLFEFRKFFSSKTVLGVVFVSILSAQDTDIDQASSEVAAFWSRDKKILDKLSDQVIEHRKPSVDDSAINQNDYTINFNNISIIEYIRFVSKITNLNFIFNEQDLQFNVTIISQEPISPRNVMSTLIQLLRVHGLSILEEDNNLLITASKSVSQIATIVSNDLPEGPSGPIPLVTRVFRINNAQLTTIATIVKSMLSDTAKLDVSPETHQLIVTDITTNVDKISTLLASIDAPHSPLEIESYEAKHASPLDLIQLGTKLVDPFKAGNPLIFIPLAGTNKIFIVSTAYLIEKTLEVFEDLDIVSNYQNGQIRAVIPYQFFVYSPKFRRGLDLEKALHDIGNNLKLSGLANTTFLQTIEHMKWIPSTNSLVFTGDEASLKQVELLLASLDNTQEVHQDGEVFIYKPKFVSKEQLERDLKSLASDLDTKSPFDASLYKAISHVKWMPDSQSFIFKVDTFVLNRLKEFLQLFDSVEHGSGEGVQTFSLVALKHAQGNLLLEKLKSVAKELKDSKIPNPALIQAIDQAKWIKDNNSILITGTPASITQLTQLIQEFDISGNSLIKDGPQSFSIYTLKHVQGNLLLEKLHLIAKDLKESKASDPALIQTIEQAKWIKDNNSILITGPDHAIAQMKQIIQEFDITGVSYEMHNKGEKTAFYIYKPIHQTGPSLASHLKEVCKNLEASGLIDPDLLVTLQTMRFVDSSQSLVFTGTPATLDKVKELLVKMDVISPEEIKIQELNQTTFLIYRVEHITHENLIKAINAAIDDLRHRGVINEHVVESLRSIKWIEETHSVIATGSKETLQMVHQLLIQFDVASSQSSSAPNSSSEPLNFVVYTPKNIPGPELIKALKDFKSSLLSSGIVDKDLFASIDQLKWIPRTSSLLISGHAAAIKQIEELLTRFDTTATYKGDGTTPLASPEQSNFLVYKLQYHQGEEILTALKKIAPEISQTEPAQTQSLLKAINSLQWITVTNSLIASGDPATLTKIKTLVQNLDIPLRQVFVEILVIETSMTNAQNFGLQWGGKMQYLNRFGAGTGNFPIQGANATNPGINGFPNVTDPFPTNLSKVSATTTPNANTMIPFFTGFDLGIIGDIIMHKGKSFISLGSLVNALQTDNDSTVIMNPKIITQDNRNSTIFVGQNVPFVGSLVASQNSFVQTNQNIEYRDIGFNLSITPTIGNSDIVTLDIANDISEVIGNPNQGTISNNTNQQPTGILTSHTNMNTRVHVPDKHFVVLSGMIQESKTTFKTSIPCLGGLPVIGALFSENDKLDQRTNVIIFVRPHIINTYEEYKTITSTQEQMYKEQAGTRILKEQFDEGIDLIKYPENE